MQIKTYADALKAAMEMLKNVSTLSFVDHENEEIFVLTDGIWKGTRKEFIETDFAHVVAGFWLLHQGDDRHYYTVSK